MHHMLLDIPSILETSRLRLRPYASGDGQWLHKVFQENFLHLAEAIDGMKNGMGLDMTNPDDAEIFVRQREADWINRKRFVLGVREKKTDQYIGEIWIENRDWDLGLHEIGYYLIKERLGQGFATEATKRGLTLLFETLKANKVALTCDEDNGSSYRVAERCGFQREGCLRNEVKKSDGTLVGRLYFGLLRNEFERPCDITIQNI